MHRVVVVGGGFGGLHAARWLRKAPVQVTLIDRRNHHLFQPLLYQVATGGLSPANIAAPLRTILRRQKNADVLLAEVENFDLARRCVLLRDGGEVPYDSLVLATGSHHSYFGRDEWSELAPGLKSIDDATSIRRKILIAFEEAEKTTDPQARERLLTFIIVGGGPTGVELAGAIAEIATQTMRDEFRHINPASAKVLLLEGGDRVLSAYPSELSAEAQRGLEKIGVDVRLQARVTGIDSQGVTVRMPNHTDRIEAESVFWAAGVQASPLGRKLADASGAPIDRAGKVTVEPDFSLAGHPDVFVIGDLAAYPHTKDGQPLPALAPVAMQAGQHVAAVIHARVAQKKPPKPFVYRDYGTMATIGRRLAVADINGWHLRGALAWYAWLFIHLMQLVSHESRLLVLIQWAYHYFTFNRGARLITGDDMRRVAHQHEHPEVVTEQHGVTAAR